MIKQLYWNRFMLFRAVSLSMILAVNLPTAMAAGSGEGDEMKSNIGRYGEVVAVDPDEFEFSPAETKLWMMQHLNNIEKPARLYYAFSKTGSFEEGFTDSVYLDILEINSDGSKNANLTFFTAEHQQRVANEDNLTNINGNPVLGVYLQGDVFEMNRLTEGSWRYFQKRIKLSIAEAATVEPISFQFEGKQIEGELITLTPYVDDPRRRSFEKFANKRYEFILSEQVPGTLYQIKTVVPDSSNPEQPLIEEVLTLKHVELRDM